MYLPVVTKDPTAVEAEVQAIFLGMFPTGDALFVSRAFGWVTECFTGGYEDYAAVDARYHDFEHTLQGTLCLARLLQGRNEANAEPPLTERMFQVGLLAILMHDTGYLKKRDDAQGTGAKYTATHVNRSADFAARLLRKKNYPPEDVRAVQNMIHCTGVDTALSVIPFQSDLERMIGFALGTADLLGQMAADDYVEKLPVLYSEFAEAKEFSHERPRFVTMFSSAEDLMQKTPAFWEKYVQAKLAGDFGGLYRFLNQPYPDGRNYYFERIDANIKKLRGQLGNQ